MSSECETKQQQEQKTYFFKYIFCSFQFCSFAKIRSGTYTIIGNLCCFITFLRAFDFKVNRMNDFGFLEEVIQRRYCACFFTSFMTRPLEGG